MIKLLLTAICVVRCSSVPFVFFFHVLLTHIEATNLVYADVVASATTILIVSKLDVTIIVYANASSVQTVVLFFIYLSKSTLVLL
jgi:hypothetical protein